MQEQITEHFAKEQVFILLISDEKLILSLKFYLVLNQWQKCTYSFSVISIQGN